MESQISVKTVFSKTGGKHIDRKDVRPEVPKRKGVLGRGLGEPAVTQFLEMRGRVLAMRHMLRARVCGRAISDRTIDPSSACMDARIDSNDCRIHTFVPIRSLARAIV